MNRNAGSFFLSALILLVVAHNGMAQTAYEDLQARFIIDLPPGWTIEPQSDETVFVFKGDGKSIILEYVSGVNDTEKLMRKVESDLRASGLTNPVLDGSLLAMTINGHPARWGVYNSGKLLASLCGAVDLGNNGICFMSIMAAGAVAAWKDRIETSFQSIRLPGETMTPAGEVTAVSGSLSASGTPKPWQSDLVALTLPPEWSEKPMPRGFEKEIKGWFMNDNLPGATLLVACYQGMGMTMGKAFDAGIKSVTIPMPGLKPIEAEEMALENGNINFAVYKGLAAAGGAEVELASVIITKKADKSFTNLIFTGMATYLPELRNQALTIAKTVR